MLPRYARMTRQVEALIASAYLWHQHPAGEAGLSGGAVQGRRRQGRGPAECGAS